MESLFTVGFPAALAWQSLGFCLLGVLIGTLLGVLLGVGPVAVVLMSLTFSSDLSASIALLAGLYYGSQYGRSISAILFGVPGGPSAVATTFDGHPMAEQGQAGRALCATLIASFFACTIATLFVAVMAAPMSGMALLLGPADYVALMVLALALTIGFAGGAPPKALLMVLLGFLLGAVGTNVNTGEARFTFGIEALSDGLSGHAVTLGLIGIAAALVRFETANGHAPAVPQVGPWLPRWSDLRETAFPMLRSSVLGSLLGVFPLGALLAPFVAYRLEERIARDPARFGTGAIEGVAAPEAANNAGTQSALLAFLSLGLPLTGSIALLAGTLTLYGKVPGPKLAANAPELYWGTIATFWIASLMVLAAGLALVGVWVKVLLVPRRLVLVALILIGCATAYTINNSFVDVGVTLVLGIVGYALMKFGFQPMPALIGFLLAPAFEEKLRQALLVSRGSYMPFVQRPLTGSILLISLLAFAVGTWLWVRPREKGAAAEA